MNSYHPYLARIEAVLARVLPETVTVDWLEAVAEQDVGDLEPPWVDRFLEPGLALLRRGGKRWRPLVTLLTCEALGGGEAGDPLAALTEIPHNGSLIIDDIEDKGKERRGGKAVHLEFGVDLALNTGNLMYYLPLFLLEYSDFPPPVLGGLWKDYSTAMRRLHLGQGLDIHWHREKELYPPVPAYARMCRFKTGSLAWLAARGGARAAGAREEQIQSLGLAWEELGLGFQILDDVKNLSTGNPGKRRGDDVVEGKKSLPVLLHASRHPEDKEKLSLLFRRAPEETPQGDWSAVEEMAALIQESGALEEAAKEGGRVLEKGRRNLEKNLPPGEARELSLGLVDSFGQGSSPFSGEG